MFACRNKCSYYDVIAGLCDMNVQLEHLPRDLYKLPLLRTPQEYWIQAIRQRGTGEQVSFPGYMQSPLRPPGPATSRSPLLLHPRSSVTTASSTGSTTLPMTATSGTSSTLHRHSPSISFTSVLPLRWKPGQSQNNTQYLPPLPPAHCFRQTALPLASPLDWALTPINNNTNSGNNNIDQPPFADGCLLTKESLEPLRRMEADQRWLIQKSWVRFHQRSSCRRSSQMDLMRLFPEEEYEFYLILQAKPTKWPDQEAILADVDEFSLVDKDLTKYFSTNSEGNARDVTREDLNPFFLEAKFTVS